MFKKLLCFSLCLSLPLLGESHPIPQGENAQIGRYQMAAMPGALYLLDTATGLVWKSTNKKNG